MLILFCSTVLLIGPAWCSHLCYLGAWDAAAANTIERPKTVSANIPLWKVFFFGLVILSAAAMRFLGASSIVAIWTASAFGVGGVLCMLLVSRRTGQLIHCTVYCPMSALATWLGKLSPFRLRIDPTCNECGLCTRYCRHGALEKKHITARRVGPTCTLCGDCLAACKRASISYQFFRAKGPIAKCVFIGLTISLHAVCLGIARI
jgi:polyferredoxin